VGNFEIRIGEHLPEEADALQQGKTPVNYSRQAAVDYALFFCNRVCSDGIVMSKSKLNRRNAGALLANVDSVEGENDCTHFVSCSLGKPPSFATDGGATLTGGGVYLSDAGFLDKGTTGVYGILEPSPLVGYLKLTRKIAFAHVDNGALSFSAESPQFFDNNPTQINELKALIQSRFTADMGRGDLVAYFEDPQKTGQHAAIVVNDDWGIACHTSSRCGSKPINDVNMSLFIYARFKEFKEDEL
jgi:hypothetical protein